MTDTLTRKDRKEIKARIRELFHQVEDLNYAIDDAAEADDGSQWEALNDRVEYRQASIDELQQLLKGKSC